MFKEAVIAAVIILVLFAAILGGLPIAPFNSIPVSAAKMLLLEWGMWFYIALFFLKNKWLRVWLIWVVLCLIFQYNRYSYAFANTILLYTLFYQVLSVKLTKRHIGFILNGICLIVWLHLCWMVLQWQGVYWLYKVGRSGGWNVFGLVSNANNAGMLLALSVPAFLRPKWRWLLPAVIGGIILSRHETSLVAVLIGLWFYLFIKFPRRRFTYTGLIIVACLGYVKFCNPKDIMYSITIRLSGYRKMWQLIKGSPLQGLGLGQFRNVFPVVQRYIYKDASLFFRAHNVPLQLLVDQGAVGLGLMAGFIFSNIERFLKNRNELGFLALIGILISLVGGLGHFTAQTSSFILCVVYFAMMVNQTKEVTDETKRVE